MNPLPWYLSAALAIALAVVSTFAWLQYERASIDAGKLTVCEQKISTQNDAVKSTAADGARRVAAAAKGVEVAAAATKEQLVEAQRLRQLAEQKGAPSACPAGDAVAEVRRGLP